eukprot:g2900.t1
MKKANRIVENILDSIGVGDRRPCALTIRQVLKESQGDTLVWDRYPFSYDEWPACARSNEDLLMLYSLRSSADDEIRQEQMGHIVVTQMFTKIVRAPDPAKYAPLMRKMSKVNAWNRYLSWLFLRLLSFCLTSEKHFLIFRTSGDVAF